jgi:hypothetical protein
MLKKARLLTRPTLARRDAPCPKQGRSEQSKMVHPSLLVCVELWWLKRVPAARWVWPFQFSPPLFRGVAEAALYCAHRTSTVSSCAFCEQEGHLATPPLLADFFSILLDIDGDTWPQKDKLKREGRQS